MSAGEVVVPVFELTAARAEIAKLQRVLGKKTLENEAVKYAAEKSVLCARPCCPRKTSNHRWAKRFIANRAGPEVRE